MRLYSRQLNSLDELKKERRRLCKIRDENAPDTWLGLDDTASSGEDGSMIADLLSGALGPGSSILNVLLSAAPALLGAIGGGKINKILKSTGKDVLSGYLKWKGIRLAIKMMSRFIKSSNKTKKDPD